MYFFIRSLNFNIKILRTKKVNHCFFCSSFASGQSLPIWPFCRHRKQRPCLRSSKRDNFASGFWERDLKIPWLGKGKKWRPYTNLVRWKNLPIIRTVVISIAAPSSAPSSVSSASSSTPTGIILTACFQGESLSTLPFTRNIKLALVLEKEAQFCSWVIQSRFAQLLFQSRVVFEAHERKVESLSCRHRQQFCQ